VIAAKDGTRLLDLDAVAALKRNLLVGSAVLVPNIPEAEALSGMTIRDVEDMRHAASILLTLGPDAVLLKGGHLDADTVVDVLATADGITAFEGSWIESRHTHGTGCTLASAIATGLAQGLDVPTAVGRGRWYVRRAIETAPGYGHGHGPLNHAHPLEP
jgi:hydroxymethylpyrimidine/phosphomethylpyrimidine kinase